MAFRPADAVPRKNLRRKPASVSARKRRFVRESDPNLPTSLACSRSTIRMTASSRNRWRSRSCRTRPLRLVEFIVFEHLVRGFRERGPTSGNGVFNVGTDAAMGIANAVREIGNINLRVAHRRDKDLNPGLATAFYDRVTLCQVLQPA